MKGSKIILFARQTIPAGQRKNKRVGPLDFVGAYTKTQQRENKKKNQQKRQAPTARDTRNYLLIQIGALWQMNFPMSKKIDPYNKQELAAIARVFALLSQDLQFSWINRLLSEALNTSDQNGE